MSSWPVTTSHPSQAGEMGDSEPRESPRGARSFLVRYKSRDEVRPVWLVATLHDFSERGARFLSERAFIIGDHLELQLRLPTAAQPVFVNATVAWTRLGKLGLVEIGVTFEAVDEMTQQVIREAVRHFVRGKEPG